MYLDLYGKIRVCKTIKPQDNIVIIFFKMCKCTPSLEDCRSARVKQIQPNESPSFTLSMREISCFSHREKPRYQPYHDRQKKETSTLNLTKPNKCSIQQKIKSTTSDPLPLAAVPRALCHSSNNTTPLATTNNNESYLSS
jgi:hypothetical protein